VILNDISLDYSLEVFLVPICGGFLEQRVEVSRVVEDFASGFGA
jgi:hypothetical protein